MINETLRDARQEDLVLVYFSGHGLLDSGGRLHLATVDTNPELLTATSVTISSIRNCVNHSRCQRFVLILDCCYSGTAGARFVVDKVNQELNGFADNFASGVGEFVMTASTLASITRKILALIPGSPR